MSRSKWQFDLILGMCAAGPEGFIIILGSVAAILFGPFIVLFLLLGVHWFLSAFINFLWIGMFVVLITFISIKINRENEKKRKEEEFLDVMRARERDNYLKFERQKMVSGEGADFQEFMANWDYFDREYRVKGNEFKRRAFPREAPHAPETAEEYYAKRWKY